MPDSTGNGADPIYHQYGVELPGGYLIVQKDTGHPSRDEIAARLLADQLPDATLMRRGVWHGDWAPAGPPDEHVATVMRRMEADSV